MHLNARITLSFLAVCLGGLLALTQAQQPSREEWKEILKAELADDSNAFEDKLADATVPFHQDYIASLLELEKRAAAHNDFHRAIAIRDERLPLEDYVKKNDPRVRKALLARAQRLLPKDAVRSGAVNLKKGYLAPWRTTNSRATWNLRGFKPGVYDVAIRYSCSSEEKHVTKNGRSEKHIAGGILSFGEDTNLIGSSASPLEYRVSGTGGWDQYKWKKLGKIEINGTAPSLRLRAEKTFPLGLMRLREVRLIPTRPEKTTPRPGPNIPSVKSLRTAYDAVIERKKITLKEAYLSELRALEAEAAKTNDSLLDEIREEIRNLEGGTSNR